MATVHEIEQRLFSWAPRESAMDWDNVGHLVGDPEQEVERILVALDITERVVQEAIDCGAQLIVSHHPVMNVRWHEREMQTLRPDTRLGGVLTALVKNNISAICMHTNLDAADGGVNDCLAKKLASNLPKPLSSISFSSLRAFFMIPSMASSTFLACCCFISDWAQIDLAISALVTVLLMVSSPESRCASDIFWCGPSGPVPFARTVE